MTELSEDYQAQYGDESWELDALDPAHIQRLIEEVVSSIRDESRWEKSLSREVADTRELNLLSSGPGEGFDPSSL